MAEQMRDGLWELTAEEAALARAAAGRLADAVGPAAVQGQLAGIERLRTAIAVIAISLAHTHGRLAWFLAQAATALTPVLDWRALVADERQAFGTRVPEPGELTDDVVRHLHTTLAAAPDRALDRHRP
ncbi:hypothetical protein [Streptomyces sp. NPDC127038]|uniref:hypothetical protein n=1 Tax=Streptomyces sp. NPDC127038 TaxID=3347114 RepID=UPI00364689A7